MNNNNDAANIKQKNFIHIDKVLCPTNAIWINCSNTYYINHSNECGPRTLLALHILAIHPHPYKEMLLPLMHPNLAQISRTWIADSLISGSIRQESITEVLKLLLFTDDRTSHIGQSTPYDVIKWESSTQGPELLPKNPCSGMNPTLNEITNLTELHLTASTNFTTPYNDKEDQSSVYIMTNRENCQFRLPLLCNTTREYNHITDSPQPPSASTVEHDNLIRRQTRITEWTINKHAENKCRYAESIVPYETPLSPINSSETLRITIQNPQYALQLTNDFSEKMQVINNLKELNAAVFVIISPNVNFCNPSNKVQFKSPFQRMYQQVHISTTSSDVGFIQQYFNRPNLTGG
jgi:hypothetical protein